MSVQIRRRGDTTMAHAGFVGAEREITIDTDKHAIVVHDGETAGGFPQAREDMSNVPRAAIAGRGIATMDADNFTTAGKNEIKLFVGADFVGFVFSAPLASAAGFLLCNGAAVSRATYSRLYAKIGTTFGEGDGSTTFNIPDYRGYFLRGKGGNSASDFKTAQADQFQGHSHHSDIRTDVYGSGDGPAITTTAGTDEGLHYDGQNMHIYEPMTRSDCGDVRFGTETRPKNYAINFFIKY